MEARQPHRRRNNQRAQRQASLPQSRSKRHFHADSAFFFDNLPARFFHFSCLLWLSLFQISITATPWWSQESPRSILPTPASNSGKTTAGQLRKRQTNSQSNATKTECRARRRTPARKESPARRQSIQNQTTTDSAPASAPPR